MTTREYILTTLSVQKPKLYELGIAEIGLFGSYVRNEQTETSDIDILIDFKPGKVSFDDYMKAYDLLEEVFVGEKVSVVTKDGLSKYIGPYILREVKYV